MSVEVPGDVPLLLIGVRETGDVEFPHVIRAVNRPDGSPQPDSHLWKAYLLAGNPTPFEIEAADPAAALEAAEAAVEQDPDNPVARELLWRLQAVSADDPSAFLEGLNEAAEQANSGRQALAAARVHLRLGDREAANRTRERFKGIIDPVIQAETRRWAEVIAARDPRSRADKIHRWMAEDPLSDFFPRCLQILAATYSELGDYRATAAFGLLSLKLVPHDAMTLNGVAFAMAEGEFELDRALLLAEQAIAILAHPERLNKPPQLSESRWREELRHAKAASLDTKGWVLTKLGHWQEARSAFDDAIDLERADVYYLHKGIMQARSGNVDAARKTLRAGARLGGPNRRSIETELARLEQ
jgi:tetratricopeptide (TPR) repeat protein